MSKRPQALPVQVENIPPELRSVNQWVTWRFTLEGDKWTKIPLQVTGRGAKSTDPQTWTNFNSALNAYRNSNGKPVDGISFALSPPIVGIDLDRCRDPKSGEIESWATEIISAVNSYTEISPSARGVHILAIGSLPAGGRKKDKIEMYAEKRFLCITGQRFDGTPETIENREAEIKELHARIFGTNGAGTRKASTSSDSADKTLTPGDKKLLKKILKSKIGKKVKKLGAGDTNGYSSPSEADLALVSLFAAFTQDVDVLDRLFRSSKLFRPKWDKRNGDGTYGSRTISKALEGKALKLRAGPYSVRDGRICRDRQTKEGIITESLCNFACRATEQELRDDGLNEPVRNYVIEGTLDDGTSLPVARVAASKFPAMNWTEESWGMRCVVRAGNGTKDFLREAIKLFSANVRLRRIYTHTGWRKLDNRWIYLGGSTAGEGDGNYEIDLGPDLTRYRLPAVADDPVGAMKLSLKLLNLAPLRITAPLFSAVFRAPLSSSLPMDMSLWLEGRTGSLKSTLAALFLSHFGDFGRLTLPAAWASTANVLEKRSFVLKDSTLFRRPCSEKMAPSEQLNPAEKRLYCSAHDH
jgi:hypothetical protein